MYTIVLAIILSVIVLGYYISLKRAETIEVNQLIKRKGYTDNKDILLDTPTTEDKIGFKDYAEVIAESINEVSDFLVYGIYGPWGTGKTSLMYMIREELKDKHKIIWFDSWKFKGKVSIFDALCQVMNEELGSNIDNRLIHNKLDKVIKQIVGNRKHYEYDIRQLNNSTKDLQDIVRYLNLNNEQKIVIFVDDLDRCDPADAVIFLESLKVFLDVRQIVFVIGVNHDILCNEVNKKFKDIKVGNQNFTEEYLSKIINVPFFIPEIDQYIIEHFIINNISTNEVVEAAKIFASGLEKNLRTVKRVINSYKILLKIAKKRIEDINPILLAKMLVIKYRYVDIYNQIILNEDVLINMQLLVNRRGGVRRIKDRIRVNNINKNSDEKLIGVLDEEINIPVELREILKMEPYFEHNSIKQYISLLKEETTQSNSTMEEEQRYLDELSKGNLMEVNNLTTFSENTQKQVINMLINNFSTYNIEQQENVIRVFESLPNREALGALNSWLNKGIIEDITLKKEVINLLISYNVNMYDFITYNKENFNSMDINDQRLFVETCIQLLNKKQKYCIDILLEVLDKFDFINNDYILREKIVIALGNSEDKKAIDILVKFLEDKSSSVIEQTLNSIGILDVTFLLHSFDRFFYDNQTRKYYLSAIVSHAKKDDKLLNEINVEEIINYFEREVDDEARLSEIKLLVMLAKVNIETNPFDRSIHDDEQIELIKEVLNKVSRYDENWRIRDECEKSIEKIKNFNKIEFL